MGQLLLNLSLTLVCVLDFIMVQSSLALDSPEYYVNVHNAARAAVRVAPLIWDERIAAYAQRHANKRINDCNLVPSIGPYGENLANSSSKLSDFDAIRSWMKEKRFYHHESNTCAPGRICSHYMQMVWRNSKRVGCAKVRCRHGGSFISCNYYPKGNLFGRWEWPY